MRAVGAAAFDEASMFDVLSIAPTLNWHTRYTAVFSADLEVRGWSVRVSRGRGVVEEASVTPPPVALVNSALKQRPCLLYYPCDHLHTH